MNTNNFFSIQEAIETHGIKNIRVFMAGHAVDHSFAIMTGLPMCLTSDSDLVDMVEFHITENNGHKIHFTPSPKYNITMMDGDVEVANASAYANEKTYTSDFESRVCSGSAKIYIETEDGYSLIYGAYSDIVSKNDIMVMEWSKNVLNAIVPLN